MNSSKIGNLCEKHAKECNLEKSLEQNKTSVCSCSKCNSFECFALRNKGNCLCYQGSDPQPCSNGSKKKITNTCRSKSSLKNAKLPETGSVLRERVKKEITYEYNNTNKVASVATVKKYSRYSYNCVPKFSNQGNIDTEVDKIKKSTEKFVHSDGSFTSPRQNFDTNTAKLSAQIMDVPYEDFKESISYNKSVVSTLKLTKLSRFDIFKRIKEACKACSCKVCECLSGKATNPNEFCKCKPCECVECATLMKSFDYHGKIKEMNLECQNLMCNRENERKSTLFKNRPPAYCNCDQCECLKCTESFNKPCDCQPCECIECKTNLVKDIRRHNTLVVASMREDVPRAYCQCSPCHCDECVQSYSIATSLRREMGTGMSRPFSCSCETCVNQSCEADDGNSCTCDVQKRLMRKPVQKDTRDYDIHRASIINNVTKEKNKNDTIAMIASLGNIFPKFETKNHSCSCSGCECIACSFKENNATLIQEKPLKYRNLRACKCSACECVICDSSDKALYFPDRKNICNCNTCDCIKCDRLPKIATANFDFHTKRINFNTLPLSACKCSPCECTECQKMMYKCTGDSCYCTNCKCQMCTKQTELLKETVYRNRNNDLSLPYLYHNNKNEEYFVKQKYGRTCLTPNSLQSDREQMESKGNIVIYNKSTSVERLKNNLVINSAQVMIENNSETKDRKRYQTTSAGEPYAQFKENKFVQSYDGASEYESSRSFMSENSSIGLFSKFSNVQLSGNLSSVMEQKYTSKSACQIETPCDRSTNSSVLSKRPVKTCLTNVESKKKYTNTCGNTCNHTNTKSETLNTTKTYHPGIIGANIKVNEFLEVNDRLYLSKPSESISELSRNDEFFVQDHEITNVKDLSSNLVASLKKANERLSILMKPRISYFHLKLGHSEADINLTRNKAITNEAIRTKNNELNLPLENSCSKYLEHISDIEIDYDKVKSTLQQAKAFSVELTKVLNEYKKTNRKFESSFSKETPTNLYNNSLLNIKHSSKTNNNKITNTNAKCKTSVEDLGQKPYSLCYEPVQKYDPRNLNVTKTILQRKISNTDDNKNTQMENSIKHLADIDSAIVAYAVDDDINMITRQGSHKLSQSNISVDEPNSSSKGNRVDGILDEDRESFKNACNQTNKYEEKCRSGKTLKNIKGSNRLRVPKTVKRIKLKEALINIASNASNVRIRQENLVPQSIQCNNIKKVIADEATQHEPYFVEDTRETTSTSTDAGGRHVTSGFVEAAQDENGLENPPWSILKKNVLINSPYSQNGGFSLLPPLLLEVKNTLRNISGQYSEPERSEQSNGVTLTGHANLNRALDKLELDLKDFKIASSQTCNVTSRAEKAVDCSENTVSLAVLQRQVRELLDKMLSVKPVVKKSLKINDVKSTASSTVKSEMITRKSSFDNLKVKFLSLRRLSDHTVLVKWKSPQDLTSVQGYELLVDGRAVQKILSPSRCMAVVTCLPHTEKVLITIRTLVSTSVERSHSPAATIVYKTRAK